MKLTDNTILITGGGSGIGRGLAEAFHALGNQVIISGRRADALAETTAANPGMKSLMVDMTDQSSIQDFAERLIAEFPALNVVINNAGIARPENLLDGSHDPADAETMISTNLLGPIRLTSALLPLLQKQPQATVMTVSSGLAFLPLSLTPTYCATKAAIHSYSQSLRYQLRKTNVEVLELIPPYVQTTLMGDAQASDPHAMPLADFITEVMSILKTQPGTTEICVQKVLSLRDAERASHDEYEKVFDGFNAAMVEALAGGQSAAL